MHRHAYNNGNTGTGYSPDSSFFTLNARARGVAAASSSGAPSSTSPLAIESSDDDRPPQPEGNNPVAWKWLVAMCTLSVVICYAGEKVVVVVFALRLSVVVCYAGED